MKQFLELPVYFFLFILILLIPGRTIFADDGSLPFFSLEDQFGSRIQSKELKQISVILIGCVPEDEELCRKIARKIYWKVQTYSYGKENQIKCIGYLALKNRKKYEFHKTMHLLRKKGYESIYLDWDGQLQSGIKKKTVYIRGFHPKKGKVIEEYWEKADNQKVKALYELVSS
jgi:hypothetical protein